MNNIEIFRPGKFKAMNGTEVSFSAEMLKDIAQSYDPKIYQAPLVIGHPKVEDPAYGWVKSLNFSGEKLSAEPEAVVEEFAGLVASKRYQHVSASFFTPDHPANPKPGKYYLKHVGFLGAVPSAVTGLKAVSFASDNEDKVIEFAFEAVKEPKVEAAAQDNNTDKRMEEFAAREKALEEREKAIAVKESEMKKAEYAAFADGLVKEGRLVAGIKDDVVSFMRSIDSLDIVSFAAEKKSTPLEFFKSFMKNQPKIVEFSEIAGENVKAPESVDDSAAFAEKITAFCAENEKKGITMTVVEAADRLLGGKK